MFPRNLESAPDLLERDMVGSDLAHLNDGALVKRRFVSTVCTSPIGNLGIPPMGLAPSATAMKQDADVTAVLSGAFPPLGVF